MQNEELEKLLRAGLESYGDIEPLAGLEDRVLRRVQEKRYRSRWMWYRWAGATAGACLLLAVIFANVSGRPVHSRLTKDVRSTTANVGRSQTPLTDSSPSDMQASRVVAANVPQPKAIHARGGNDLVAKQSEARPKDLPKLNLFPTPHPLTLEERALVEFVYQHPQEVQQLVDAERRSDEPIQIAAIHIGPLKIDGPQQKGEKDANDY